jgi:group II intron reverse transcriptase/maturase
MVLEAVFEQDFLTCSYGYRPGRSAHMALGKLWQGLMEMGGGWVLEVDIQSFFDSLDHHQLRSILDQRVRDGVVRRTIDKWLAAGVLEGAELTYPDAGTPQGGVISPLLANIYLHEVVDKWFEKDVKPRLRGRAFMVRFADDLVMAFAAEKDARRVMAALAKRLAKYGLILHPDKTRLLCFRPQAGDGPLTPGSRSFDFLGFTHYCRLATPAASGEATRAQQLLRDHRQLPCVVPPSPRNHASLAEVAGSPLRQGPHELAALWEPTQALPTPRPGHPLPGLGSRR